MPGVGKKIRHISAMFSFIVLSLSGCGTDEFSAPFIQLQKRLDDYQISKNAAPVYEWVSQYHGEAPGHRMMITFVEWGNLYVPEMNILLKKWPATERSETFDRLKWAAADSGQPIKFAIPDAGQQAGAAGTR